MQRIAKYLVQGVLHVLGGNRVTLLVGKRVVGRSGFALPQLVNLVG